MFRTVILGLATDGGCGRDRDRRSHLCDRQSHDDDDRDNNDPRDTAMACPLCEPFHQPHVGDCRPQQGVFGGSCNFGFRRSR
jgi:hypothetical protein